MVKVDLITGFLGAGKTTFLRKYAEFLLDQGLELGILENDYGAVNVDMMLLQDLYGEHCELEMVAGGCDYDCHKRRFKTKLIAMGMCGYDRVLIEPSGIYDTDEFFDVLQEEPLDNWYEIGNVIMIVDGNLEEDLSEQSRYLLASQLAVAGKLVVSRGEGMSAERLRQLCDRLNAILQEFRCKKVITEKMLICKDWEKLTEEDYRKVLESGYTNEYYQKKWLSEEEGYKSCYFMDLKQTPETVRQGIKILLEDDAYGKIFRVKGFSMDEHGIWQELNATKDGITVRKLEQGQDVLIVIGENLKQDIIQELFDRIKEQNGSILLQ